jgi:Ca2+-transporting ATPase
VHIVWLELMIHPTALLVFPQLPPSNRLVGHKRAAQRRFFDAAEWTIIAIVGLMVTTMIALGYVRSLGPDQDVQHARSMAISLLIASSAAVTLGLSGLRVRSGLVAAAAALLSAIVLVQVAPLAQMLHLDPLHVDDWLLAAVAGLLPGVTAWGMSWRAQKARVQV